MKGPLRILLVLAALALACPSCNEEDGASSSEVVVSQAMLASFEPQGGFVAACPGAGSRLFLAGGRTLLCGPPFRLVALPPEVSEDARLRAVTAQADSVIAVGERGLVLVSTDGGVSFTPGVLSAATRLDLNAVATDGRAVVAVGERGTIVTAELAGPGVTPDPFTPLRSGVGRRLNSVVRAGAFWAAVGEGVVLVSTDGLIWTLVDDPEALAANHNAALLTQAGDLVLVGDGGSVVVLRAGSTDFVRVNSGVSADLNAVAQGPGPGAPVIAVGNQSAIIAAADPAVDAGLAGGWTTGLFVLPQGLAADLRTICATEGGELFVAGEGLVLRAAVVERGQAQFRPATLGGLRAVHAVPGGEFFCVGAGGLILHQGPAGLSLVPSPTGEALNDVFAVQRGPDTVEATAVGESGRFIQILRQGITFTTGIETAPFAAGPLKAVFAARSGPVLAVGGGGRIVRRTSRLRGFLEQPSPTTSDLNDVFVLDTLGGPLAVAVAENGQVLVANGTGGFTGAALDVPIATPLRSVSGFFDGGAAAFVVCGDGGRVFLLRPVVSGGLVGGFTVADISPPLAGGSSLRAVCCPDERRLFVAGDATPTGPAVFCFEDAAWSCVDALLAELPAGACLCAASSCGAAVSFAGSATGAPGSDTVLLTLND